MNNIRFLRRHEIDVQLWDKCIVSSANSLPYALSWYLDLVAENWDAVIFDNYKIVMPLVWLRKLGVKCLYQPYYCQQLGVFGKNPDPKLISECLHYAISNFSYVDMNLNCSSEVVVDEFRLKPKKNLLLDLNHGYVMLEKKYSENHKRNIRKAQKAKTTFEHTTALKDFQKFYLENVKLTGELFKAKHEKIFRTLTEVILKNRTGKVYTANNSDGSLLAAVLLVRHQNRLIAIINTSAAAGKASGASHFLFDRIIEKYSDTETTFDFEGSSVPGIARFYSGFGAKEEIFYNYNAGVLTHMKQRF